MQQSRGTTGVALKTIDIEYDGRTLQFVPLVLNDHWILKIVGGEGAHKGYCRECLIARDIRTKLKDKVMACRNIDSPPSNSSSAVADDDDADPMSKLKKTPRIAEKERPSKSNKKLTTTKAVHPFTVEVICVPAKCGDPAGDTREITVMMSLNNSLSISIDDIPWLCEYIASETNGGLIPEPLDPDVSPSGEPFRCEWSPDGKWTAFVDRGPLQGKVFIARLTDLNQEKWDKGARLLRHTTFPEFCNSGKPDQKTVLLAYLEDAVASKMMKAEGEVVK